MCSEEFITGKLYKALCGCSLKVKGTSTHRALEKPWYSPSRYSVIATDTYMCVEIDFKTSEAHPCTFGGDVARVLAKDRIAFDEPMEFEPISPESLRGLIDKPTHARGNSYDPVLVEKLVKVARAGYWGIVFDNAPDEVMRGRLVNSKREEEGRFLIMPKRGIC